jgi:hypothetical protein
MTREGAPPSRQMLVGCAGWLVLLSAVALAWIAWTLSQDGSVTDPAGDLCAAICNPASSEARDGECWCGEGDAAELVVH